MDDLHDAIENARYEECISEAAERKIPSPILPWSFPDEATLQAWKDKIMESYISRRCSKSDLLPHMRKSIDVLYEPEPFTLEWVLTDSIGFFMFCTYVWDLPLKQFKAVLSSTSNHSSFNVSSAVLDEGNIDSKSSNHISPPRERPGLSKHSSVARFHRDSYEDSAQFLSTHLSVYHARYAHVKFMIDVIRYQRVVRQVKNGDSAARLVLKKKVEHLMDRYILSKRYSGRKNLDHLGKEYDDIARMPSVRRVSLGTGENVDDDAVIGVYDEEEGGDKDDSNVSKREDPMKMEDHKSGRNSTKVSVTRTCCLGIGGKPLEDTISAVESGPPYTLDLFQEIELYVVAQLKHFYWNSFTSSPVYTRLLNFLWYRDKKVVEEDFIHIRKLGRGGFGLVYACKKGTSGKLYAMKAMHKKRVKIKKAEKLILNERIVLASVDSPFVVNLKYAFQSRDNIFLILDLMTGGDLSFHLAQRRQFTQSQARYYASCIMLGVQALHNQHFVYRDLKPENILMGDDGRIKITDMGLACKITPGLHGACGTRGYWAPEMLRRDSKGKRMCYGHSVDWFSFGCMLAEFISGVNPFRSDKALKFGNAKGFPTKEKALDCATLEMEPEFDIAVFDADAADICAKLLNKDENKRIGTHNGCQDLMVHPWFKGMNWDAIINNTETPPFLPAREVNAASQSVIGEFEEDKVFRSTVLNESDLKIYDDWDWTNPGAYGSEIVEFLAYERKLGRPLLPMGVGDGCCCTLS